MRRQFVVVMFAVLAAVAAASAAAAGRVAAAEPRENAAPAPVAVQRIAMPATGIRDEAAMVLVGTALIGLAAAVRRAA